MKYPDSGTDYSAVSQRIQKLVSMSEQEFAQKYLSGLSANELAQFLEECPEFPAAILPEDPKEP